jgi:hypothetical protein
MESVTCDRSRDTGHSSGVAASRLPVMLPRHMLPEYDLSESLRMTVGELAERRKVDVGNGLIRVNHVRMSHVTNHSPT